MKRRLPYKSKEVQEAKTFIVRKSFQFNEDHYSAGEEFIPEVNIGCNERKKRQLYEQRFINLPEPVKVG